MNPYKVYTLYKPTKYRLRLSDIVRVLVGYSGVDIGFVASVRGGDENFKGCREFEGGAQLSKFLVIWQHLKQNQQYKQ